MWRLYDQPRPVAWWFLRFVSKRYHDAYQMRHLADWERIGVRRAHFLPATKTLYVRNEKAACSSLARIMQNAGAELERQGQGGHVEGMGGCQLLLPALTNTEVYRFSFVRHPASRALSAFNNLFALGQNKARWLHVPYLGGTGLRIGEVSEKNFDRYIAYVREAMQESKMFCDNHLRLQSINLLAGHVSYNRIGKLENYDGDLAIIAEEAGIAGLIGPARASRVNRTGKGGYLSPTDAQLRALYAIYEEDYDRYGYTRDLPAGA